MSNDAYRVLYVEDAFDQAALVKAFFNTLSGYHVVHSQDGDHAMELIATREWDLLVTDLNLPGTDGFQLIRAMRAKNPTLPILVTTGYTQAQYEEQSLRAGADQVMIKPLSQADFVARVASMVARADVPAHEGDEVVLVVEGRLGDAEMGCGGTIMEAVSAGARVVVLPLLGGETEDTRAELKASGIATSILGCDFEPDRATFGNPAAQRAALGQLIQKLRPTTVYLPAPDDRDPHRKSASDLARSEGARVRKLYGYETASTGLDFSPSVFVDVRAEMVMKMEALAAYQSMGCPRVDLRPRMAQAYARYWGRFRDFTEVEAFESVAPLS